MDPLPETVPEVSSVPSVPAVKYPWLKSVIAAAVVVIAILVVYNIFAVRKLRK